MWRSRAELLGHDPEACGEAIRTVVVGLSSDGDPCPRLLLHHDLARVHLRSHGVQTVSAQDAVRGLENHWRCSQTCVVLAHTSG